MRVQRIGAIVGAIGCLSSTAIAQGALGAAQQFGVLAATTITNTGASFVNGNLGVAPGTAITGLGGIGVTGTVHQNDALALQAQTDASSAYAALAALLLPTDLSGQNLGGLTLTPGVYFFMSSAQLTGNVTLDFQGLTNARFVFQIGSTLTTASNASVTVLNGSSNSGLYWLVGSSATLGTGTDFWGNILADQSITLNTGANIVCGRAIALHAAVTMDGNKVSNNCANGGDLGTGHIDFGSLGLSGGAASTTVPEPSTFALLFGALCLALPVVQRRRTVAA